MSGDPKDERIRELEEEVRRLSVMLESAPDFITRVTVDGDFLYVNRVAPGYRMSDIVGTSVLSYVPPQFQERALRAIRLARETGTIQQYATLGNTGADQIGHYLTRVSPVFEDGKITSLVMIATDVTALEENRIQLQVALDATGLGIWTHLPGGTGTWDETTRQIIGDFPDGIVADLALLLEQRIHPEDRALVSDGLKQAEVTGRYGPFEHRIVRPDGEVR
ncbi:MAG TPA: PAS domain-containing protein, partial [Polyangiaceae bacterium]